MSLKLQQARHKYWQDVYAIQRQHGCTVGAARDIYRDKKAGVPTGSVPVESRASSDEITPEQMADKARRMARSIEERMKDLHAKLELLERDLRHWNALGNALETPVETESLCAITATA